MAQSEMQPSSVELKQLSSLKHELTYVDSHIAKCSYDDIEYFQNVKAYIEARIQSIQCRL